MHRSPRRFTRTLTFGTAAALGLSGLLIAPTAFAASAGTDAAVTGADYQKHAEVLLEDDLIQAVGTDADGNLVIIKTAGESSAVDKLTAANPDVVIEEISKPIEPTAANDVVGGAGYYVQTSATTGGLCSVGFSGFTPAGDPAVITAGHCAGDGAAAVTELTVPAGDVADVPAYLADLGTFGFAQWGGVGGTVGGEDTNSTDIGVIDVTNRALNLKPEVTTWANVADLSATTVPITAVGRVDPALAVSKSGRTTQYTTSAAGNVFMLEGYAKVGGRNVFGFGVWDLESTQGDSGGAVIQGSTAVGLVSGGLPAQAGQRQFVWATDLVNGLSKTGGYTVEVQLGAPALTSPATGGNVERGTAITGTGPASTTIIVDPAVGETVEATTDAAGVFSFLAPGTLGAYPFTLQAKSGYSLSPTSAFSVNVIPAPLRAPVITAPLDGSSSTDGVTEITGTAVPGATVTLTGSGVRTGTAVATANGAGVWRVATDLSYGVGYSVSVTQAFEGQTSPAASTTFNVVPTAAVIGTPADGASFANGEAPTTVSGTGIDGATITLIHNGGTAVTTTVANGRWSFTLGASAVGANTLLVTQSIDGVATLAQSSYTLAAAQVAAVPRDPSLAVTGSDILPIGGLAAVLLLAGAAFLTVRKLRIGTARS